MRLLDRLAATTTCYLPYTLEDALEGIAAAGYRLVELAAIRGVCEHVPLDAGAETLGRIRGLLDQHSLTPVVLSAHSNLATGRGLDDARRALDLCGAMEIALMNTAVGGAEEGPEDETAFLRNIDGLAEHAAGLGVTITLEIHGALTATGESAARLMRKIDRPNVRINYDTANCEYYGNVRAKDDLPFALPWMGLCHLKDKIGEGRVWNFPGLGEGHVDFARLLGMMKWGGYEGPFCVEVEFLGEPWPNRETVSRALKASRDHLARLDPSSVS